MSLKTISFRAASAKIDELDSLASSQQRDRTFLLNEAIDNFLDLHHYHQSLIEQGRNDVKAGKLTPHHEVRQQLSAQRRRRKTR